MTMTVHRSFCLACCVRLPLPSGARVQIMIEKYGKEERR